MILKNPREAYKGQPPENVFVALDERSGSTLGTCVISPSIHEGLFPGQPYQVQLDLTGGGEAIDTLIGAALARAKSLCSAQKHGARIYVNCPPDDDELLETVKVHGFRDNDGVVRMSVQLPAIGNFREPAGCVVIRDDISVPEERRLFVDRWNALFNEDRSPDWVDEFSDHDNFRRVLTVAPTGMAGEVIYWTEKGQGRIAYLHTSKRWRNMSVAKYMLSLACDDLRRLGAYRVNADVRVKIPYLLHTMESFGFRQKELLVRYPGIDIQEG